MARPELPRSSSQTLHRSTQSLRFAIALALWMGISAPVEAADELQKWLRGSSAKEKENGLPVLAQTTNRSKDAETQAPGRDWAISASLKGYYDNWRNDFTPKEKGNQFAEILSLGLDVNKLFLPSGYLSILVEGGAIESELTRGRSSTSLEVPTDTTAMATYSTFDGKTWGFEGSVNFNFPTGKTRLTELELTATPNPSVVSRSLQGRGSTGGWASSISSR